MNRHQRKEIKKLLEQLEEIKEQINMNLQEEQDKYDNMPENLQMSEKAENMQEVISNLEDAKCSLEDVISSIENVIFS